MSPINRALWLNAKQELEMAIRDAPYPSPGARELVIKTTAVAINPADYKFQRVGMFLTSYPAILGCDAAGIVQQVGPDLAYRFKVGDRVFGVASCLVEYKYSGFQEFVLLREPYLATVPYPAEFTQAVVLPLGVWTSSLCLFAKETLDLKLPGSPPEQGKTLLIWGASSSVGCCGVQLAAAAGYRVLAVASPRNHDMLKSLGATKCFDYKSGDVVKAVAKKLRGEQVVGAFDCISEKETIKALCEVLHLAEADSKLVIAVQPGAEVFATHAVTVKTNFAVDFQAFEEGVGTYIWKEFLPSALEAETFHYKPDPEIVGHGLENVQEAVNLLAEGVSAKKLVVTI